ncbi:DCL family protein [Sphingorhabdus sp. M41]|uniref:DCL family protein n=1 Tax=Sphingorhabdus sp. M41 TaxID=1806885 RepID=UPI003FA73188
MLNSYDPGDRVTTRDNDLLSALVLRHPESSEKIGSGIKDFSVRSADFGTQCFWINRIDGTSEKFAFRSCIYTPRNSP